MGGRRTDGARTNGRLKRRVITVPALIVAAVLSLGLLPLWLVVSVLIDVVRRRWRLPIARLGLFGLCWAWLELAGVTAAAIFWLAHRSRDVRLHARLQRWWAGNLMAALRLTTGIRIETPNVEAFEPGPLVVLCRHASLADSLVSAHVIISGAGLTPRYAMKRELLLDPCLDIVGHRIPNYFIDRDATDSQVELGALEQLSSGMGAQDCAVIFPEGTRANPTKRARAIDKIGASDPDRAARLAALTTLLPVRPAGTQAMLRGAPDADVVICWHVGFDGLDTFGGILHHLSKPMHPVQFVATRVARNTLPPAEDTTALTRWLDDRWAEMDTEVHKARVAIGAPDDKVRT